MALSKVQKLAYSVGHILNDLCAAMWFSYLLVFLHKILQFSSSMAGYLLLVGQIADGIATPLIGYESDKSNIVCKYGRRKSWHLVGTICVTLSFPLLFMRCISCQMETAEYAQFIYFAPLVVIFQFGWASTQINHLALIPDLVNNVEKDNVDLNSYRYGFTVASSIVVYSLAWLVLDLNGAVQSAANATLSPMDATSFRTLVLAVVGIGVLFSLIFHVFLKEKPRSPALNVNAENGSAESPTKQPLEEPSEISPLLGEQRNNVVAETSTDNQLHWYDWFRRPGFYVIAFLYMFTRLCVNLSQVYMPMYLTDTLLLHKKYIAIVPLVSYVSSFITTFVIRQSTKIFKQEPTYFAGTVFVLGSCVWGHFMQTNSMQVFGQAVILGIGTSIMLVMSLSMTASLIGPNTETGAFVYGAMSFMDKVSNGVAVVIVQHLNPCAYDCPECAVYFRIVMTYLIGAITLCSLLALALFVYVRKYPRRPTAVYVIDSVAEES